MLSLKFLKRKYVIISVCQDRINTQHFSLPSAVNRYSLAGACKVHEPLKLLAEF
jgi:hypothetical protein